MIEKFKNQLDVAVKNIEARTQLERMVVLVILIAVLGMGYLTFFFDPISAQKVTVRSQISSVERQIQDQQVSYVTMERDSQEDPNKFVNDRLAAIAQEQAELDAEIGGLAGNLVSPTNMTAILSSVLGQQDGLELISFSNSDATALGTGISAADQQLVEGQAGDVLAGLSGQVFQHGFSIQFRGDFFNTLKYLRFLEDISGSFLWDSISFRREEWPSAVINLEIHTLSANAGFIGV
ncbi:MAG: hypothetical protein HQ498_07390 [Pseudohongiella sp.]|nr:hypothetical protein [Pseudohongiella sp.]